MWLFMGFVWIWGSWAWAIRGLGFVAFWVSGGEKLSAIAGPDCL